MDVLVTCVYFSNSLPLGHDRDTDNNKTLYEIKNKESARAVVKSNTEIPFDKKSCSLTFNELFILDFTIGMVLSLFCIFYIFPDTQTISLWYKLYLSIFTVL